MAAVSECPNKDASVWSDAQYGDRSVAWEPNAVEASESKAVNAHRLLDEELDDVAMTHDDFEYILRILWVEMKKSINVKEKLGRLFMNLQKNCLCYWDGSDSGIWYCQFIYQERFMEPVFY